LTLLLLIYPLHYIANKTRFLNFHIFRSTQFIFFSFIPSWQIVFACRIICYPKRLSFMKKFFCIAALLGFINHSFAQNSNPWPTTGNVGIGTATPTTALQVVGDIRFGSNGTYTDLKLSPQTPLSGYNQTNIITSLTAPGSGTAKAALYLKNAGSVGITRMDLLVDGNVGIGTTATTGKLSVLSATEQLRLSYDASNYASFTTASNGGLNFTTTGGGNLNFNPSGGAVVIAGGLAVSGINSTLYIPSTSGAVTSSSILHQFGGSTTNFLRTAFYGNGSTTLTEGANYSSTIFAGSPITTFTSGAHPWLANTVINPLGAVTAGGAAVTNTASLYVGGASAAGINNYALYSVSGTNYFGGNIGIGATDTRGYKLAVNGTVIATSVTVKLYNAWPDYVFKKDYKLPTLNEVKDYIDKNHHLPDMPSEKEVADNGFNLGEMNKILVKKVEELTLYMIEKDKENKEQRLKNEALETRLQKLEKLLTK
jgi:hypothetical protein